jgi:hypothetical protein
MSLIRRKHRGLVRELLADAGRLAGLERYLQPVAWAALGAAAATALRTINKRAAKSRAAGSAPMGAAEDRQLANGFTGNAERLKIQHGRFDIIWNFVAPVVIRAAQNYAVHQLEQWISRAQTAATIHGSSRSDGIEERRNRGISRPAPVSGACQSPGTSSARGGCHHD